MKTEKRFCKNKSINVDKLQAYKNSAKILALNYLQPNRNISKWFFLNIAKNAEKLTFSNYVHKKYASKR